MSGLVADARASAAVTKPAINIKRKREEERKTRGGSGPYTAALGSRRGCAGSRADRLMCITCSTRGEERSAAENIRRHSVRWPRGCFTTGAQSGRL